MRNRGRVPVSVNHCLSPDFLLFSYLAIDLLTPTPALFEATGRIQRTGSYLLHNGIPRPGFLPAFDRANALFPLNLLTTWADQRAVTPTKLKLDQFSYLYLT